MIFSLRVLAIVTIVAILGGIGFLALSDIPAPSKTVVKTIPDNRFPR